MILFPEWKSTIKGEDELEKVSMNLPDNLIIRIQSDGTFEYECAIYVIPHNIENRLFAHEYHMLYKGRYKTTFSELIYSPYKSKTTIKINLNQVPDEYNKIELIGFHQRKGESLDVFFADKNDRNILFGYMFNYPEILCSIHIGTLAKTDENKWKFHPIMDTEKTQLELQQKYFDGFQ